MTIRLRNQAQVADLRISTQYSVLGKISSCPPKLRSTAEDPFSFPRPAARRLQAGFDQSGVLLKRTGYGHRGRLESIIN